MEEKIKEELLELEKELQKLNQTTKQVEDIKNFSKETINSINEIQKKVSQNLEIIMTYYSKYLTESKAIFEENVVELKESSRDILKKQENILNKTIGLIESNDKLIEKLEKVDFPSRLDKIDVSVSSINQSNLNILMKLENMEKSLKEESERNIEKVYAKLADQNKSIKLVKIGLAIILVVGVAILIFK